MIQPTARCTSLTQAHVHGRWNGRSTVEPAPRINNRSPKVNIGSLDENSLRYIPSIVNLVVNSCQVIYIYTI
jgi:hypothetical protein